MKTIGVIIRTLNEQKYLEELLCALRSQDVPGFDLDLVVDLDLTDKTLEIAQAHGARITKIKKEEFSFGRSLNIGCEFALGEILVFISGQCSIMISGLELVKPLSNGCVYTYGRQVGRDTTKFSETLLFEKYFPDQSMAPQLGFSATMQMLLLIVVIGSCTSLMKVTRLRRHGFGEEVGQ